MIKGLGTPITQMVNLNSSPEVKTQNNTKADTKKEPDRLDTIKNMVAKNEYKLDMGKTAQAFVKNYA